MLKSKWGTPQTSLLRPHTDLQTADTLIVLDAANLAARANHAYSDLRNAAGEYTGHVFGVLKMTLSAFNTFKHGRTAIVVALEGLPIHRFQIMPGYKSSRRGTNFEDVAEMPYDPRSDQMLALSTLPTIFALAPAGEADDVIASIVLHRRPGQKVFVVSTDKDIWQLHGTPMTAVVGMKNKQLTAEDIRQRFGLISASMIPAWKALLGDASDCIPRVPRLATDATVSWLNTITVSKAWRGVETLFDADLLTLLPEKQAALVRLHADQIVNSYRVTLLDGSLPVRLEPMGSRAGLESLIHQFQMVSLRHLLSEWYDAA